MSRTYLKLLLLSTLLAACGADPSATLDVPNQEPDVALQSQDLSTNHQGPLFFTTPSPTWKKPYSNTACTSSDILESDLTTACWGNGIHDTLTLDFSYGEAAGGIPDVYPNEYLTTWSVYFYGSRYQGSSPQSVKVGTRTYDLCTFSYTSWAYTTVQFTGSEETPTLKSVAGQALNKATYPCVAEDSLQVSFENLGPGTFILYDTYIIVNYKAAPSAPTALAGTIKEGTSAGNLKTDLTFNYTPNSDNNWAKYQWRENGGAWTDLTNAVGTHTFTDSNGPGLSTTTYDIRVAGQGHDQYSGFATVNKTIPANGPAINSTNSCDNSPCFYWTDLVGTQSYKAYVSLNGGAFTVPQTGVMGYDNPTAANATSFHCGGPCAPTAGSDVFYVRVYNTATGDVGLGGSPIAY